MKRILLDEQSKSELLFVIIEPRRGETYSNYRAIVQMEDVNTGLVKKDGAAAPAEKEIIEQIGNDISRSNKTCCFLLTITFTIMTDYHHLF